MDPIESLRDFAERATTLEWGLAVVAATAVFWALGFALQKLFGSKRPGEKRGRQPQRRS